MFTIEQTEEFQSWLDGLDNSMRPRISGRLTKIIGGNFGDHKSLGEGLCELRYTFGPGCRVYYTIRGMTVVLLCWSVATRALRRRTSCAPGSCWEQ